MSAGPNGAIQRPSKDHFSAIQVESTVVELEDPKPLASKPSKDIRHESPEFSEREQKMIFYQGRVDRARLLSL